MKQKVIFLFFCTIFAAGRIFSQKINYKTGNLLFTSFTKKPVQHSFLLSNNIDITAPAKQFLPADFYITQIGFFCKQEIKFEKLTKVPFRFRLGSVEECDRMEGKIK
jgi:hypothetical protein